MFTFRKLSRIDKRGFTLVEMAIVLVIIGIILGAVLKGQDLIDNARAKQFVTKIKTWEVALNTYFDRKGRYPGDADKNGIIGDSDPQADITAASFVSAPENSFVLGGATFYVFIGNDGAASPKNYLVVCKTATCGTAFDPAVSTDLAALKYFESFDTSHDGSADATAGDVRGAITTVTISGLNAVSAITAGAPAADWLTGNTKKALTYQLK